MRRQGGFTEEETIETFYLQHEGGPTITHPLLRNRIPERTCLKSRRSGGYPGAARLRNKGWTQDGYKTAKVADLHPRTRLLQGGVLLALQAARPLTNELPKQASEDLFLMRERRGPL